MVPFVMTSVWAILLTVLLIGLVPAMAMAERRVALVVGNSAYTHFDPLPNATRDASDIASALDARGFEVTLLRDATHPDFAIKLNSFALSAAGADVALFYFSGHGFQVNGVNYLAPVGAAITQRNQIDAQTLRLDDVIAQISAPGRRSIILLDACRNNPLPPALQGAGPPGLAVPETGRDTFVAFATQPGNLTYDGVAGQNSPFTQALLRHMGTEGQAISRMMISVRNQVEAHTAGRQIPWDQSSLTVPFFFNPFQPTDRDLADLATMSPAMQDRILNLWRAQGAQIATATQPTTVAPAMANTTLPDFSAALIYLDEPAPEAPADVASAPQPQIVTQTVTPTAPQRVASAAVVPPRRPTRIVQQSGAAAPLAQTETRPEAALQALVPRPAEAVGQTSSRRDLVALAALPQADQRPRRSAAQPIGITRALPLTQISAQQALPAVAQPFRPDAPIAWLAALPPAHRAPIVPGVRRIIGIDVTPPEAAPELVPEPVVPAMSAEELARAVQTELQRVGCYRSGIDGDFGPGSRRALRDYLSSTNQTAVGEAPSLAILEQVRLTQGTVCAAPVARQTPRRQAPAAAPQAPAPAAPTGRTLEGALRIFR